MQGPFRRLLRHMQGHRSTVRLASFCSIMNKFWDLAPPLLIGVAVDVDVLIVVGVLCVFCLCGVLVGVVVVVGGAIGGGCGAIVGG